MEFLPESGVKDAVNRSEYDKTTLSEPQSGLLGKSCVSCDQGEKTLAELAQPFDVHANRINGWKRKLLEAATGVFGGPLNASLVEPGHSYEATSC